MNAPLFLARKWRPLLCLLALALGSACASNPSPVLVRKPKAPPAVDRQTKHLTDLMTSVRLNWLLLIKPQDVLGLPWLSEPLGRILRDDRLALLAQATGIDLRKAKALALARYDDEVTAFAIRHPQDQLSIERKFRERITRDPTRRIEGHQLVHASGLLGRRKLAFAAIGRDVAVFQYGGDLARGPARLATLYARGKLVSIPRVLEDRTLKRASARLDAAPLTLILRGPFEDKVARGGRGLLGAALAVGLTLRPTKDEGFILDLVLLGDYSSKDSPNAAADLLLHAWQDLQKSALGNLLGLRTARAITHRQDQSLHLRARLDGVNWINGLAAATVDDVAHIMK
jgi:hypothetical protein